MILTFTGRHVDPFRLEAKDISIRDIAHALSMTCRWGGHTSQFYSVAEHSVRLVEFVPVRHPSLLFNDTRDLQRWLLLHDASEAYLTDVPSPYKAQPEFAAFVAFEKKVQDTIEEHFNITDDATLRRLGKAMDTRILGNEAEQLLPLERLALPTLLPEPLDGEPDVKYRARGGLYPASTGGSTSVPPRNWKVTDTAPWGWTPEVAEANFLDQYTRLFGATD